MEVLDLLRVLLVLVLLCSVLWSVPVGPLARWRLRRRMIATLDPDLPDDVRQRAVADLRAAVPLRGRPARAPSPVPPLPRGADPAELRYRLTIPPAPDGCPGVALTLPWLSTGVLPDEGAATRQVATVTLGRGRAVLLVVLGRVGQVADDVVVAAARDRPAATRAVGSTGRPVGDVLAAGTAAGPAWRHTIEMGASVLTDTHVDHDGWAFVLGLLRRDGDASVDGLDDAVLATWEWIAPDRPDAPRDVEQPTGPAPAPSPASSDRLRLHDAEGATLASCRRPAAPAELVARDVPCPDGSLTCVHLRLTSTASLVVTTGARDPARDARAALEQPVRHAWGPRVTPTGPVRERVTPAGTVLSRTFQVAGLVRTEVRLDRDGRAWRWLLTYAPGETAVLAVLEDVLQSWRWESAAPSRD